MSMNLTSFLKQINETALKCSKEQLTIPSVFLRGRKMRDVRIFFRYPYLIFFIIAGVSLFVGLVNFHSSITVKDYIETEGEICNLESKQVLWHQHYVIRYDMRTLL